MRDGLEKTANDVERAFMELQDVVRACPTFAKVDDDERTRLERDIFEVAVPGGGK